VLLKSIPAADRGTVAGMLEDAFVDGVHSALVVLHEAGLAPGLVIGHISLPGQGVP